MRVVVDIPPDLVDEIRGTVREGDYESPEEFLERALRTQLQLESSDQENLMSFSDAILSNRTSPESGESAGTSSPSTSSVEGERLDLEDLSEREFEVPTVEPPGSERIDNGPLWGQYNRIFPMKLCVRRLAIVLADTASERVAYDRFRDETARVAREYGLRLEEVDDERGRGRGEKFSAALPTGDKVERSLDRFKTHFVGQIDSSGNLTGSLPSLQFADIHPETREFGLTDAGLGFALEENPLLDKELESTESLSETERRFYLDHVATELPSEYEAMRVVANAIVAGIDRPGPLSKRVGELSTDWTSAQASTIRSGLVGRMYELGLVSRRRVGARGIGYELTDSGERELL